MSFNEKIIKKLGNYTIYDFQGYGKKCRFELDWKYSKYLLGKEHRDNLNWVKVF